MLRRKTQATWDNLQGWLRLRILRHTVGLRLNPRTPETGADFELLQRVLQSARDSVGAWGGKLYFVYLPSQDVFLDSDFARQNEPERRRILSILESLHLPVIDLQPVLGSRDDLDSLYAIPGAHFSPRGYELMGRTIADALKADGK